MFNAGPYHKEPETMPSSAFQDPFPFDLLDLLPDFVIALDADQTIIAWNRQAEQLLGYTRQLAVGQNFVTLLARGSFTQQPIELMQAQITETESWEGEIALSLKDGRHAWFFIRARRITLNNGQFGTLIVSTHLENYEVRHHLAQAMVDYSQKELSSILSAVGDMVCAYDLQSQSLAFVSPSCYKLTGYSEYEFMDNPQLFLEMVSPPYYDLVLDALQQAQADQTITIEYFIHQRNGEKRWVLNSITPIPDADGSVNRIICAITDTTAYRELNELKSRMMRMASHDLNNPLSTAVGFLGLLTDDLYDSLSPDHQDMIASIERAHDRMATMLSELLNYEKIASQDNLTLEPLNLIELIDATLEEFAIQIKDHQHSIHFAPHTEVLTVKAQRNQLQHALDNYISNAIKYTPPKGNITIAAFQEDNKIVLEVTDDGYGVPEDHRSRLFDAFFRAKQAGTEHIKGTGIGLSLVKSIIKHQGGDVYYRAAENGGSTFGLWLPMP